MPTAQFVLAAALLLVPTIAAAQHVCESQRTPVSCTEGQIWDAEARKCILPSS